MTFIVKEFVRIKVPRYTISFYILLQVFCMLYAIIFLGKVSVKSVIFIKFPVENKKRTNLHNKREKQKIHEPHLSHIIYYFQMGCLQQNSFK